MPAQVPVQNAHGAFVPRTCRSLFTQARRVHSFSRGGSCTGPRACRLTVTAGQQVNQLEANQAAEATPLPQEQGNGSSNIRQKAQQRGTEKLWLREILDTALVAADQQYLLHKHHVHVQRHWTDRMPSSPSIFLLTRSRLGAQMTQSSTR